MELVGSAMQCHPPVVVRSGVYATDKAILPGEDDLMAGSRSPTRSYGTITRTSRSVPVTRVVDHGVSLALAPRRASVLENPRPSVRVFVPPNSRSRGILNVYHLVSDVLWSKFQSSR